jgi:2-C-methyl-D-erythritol 4-phosphate cytidylyltransferase
MRMKLTNKLWAIVPAAGIGQRMSSTLPKQYANMHNKPILTHTLEVICRIPNVEQVVIPLHPNDIYWKSLIHLPYDNFTTITGGDLRSDSVFNALLHLKKNQAQANDWVLVHDAVRPYITVAGITELLNELADHPVGGLWGVPVRDTLKEVDSANHIVKTIDRNVLWHAQTPQIFRFELLYQALLQAQHDKINITDEASAIEHLGYHPKMVQGSYSNIKITWPEDLRG